MDKKKKMHEELEEIEEKFACVPQLAYYFQQLEKEIRYYNCYQWEEGVTQERLVEKQQTMMALVGKIDHIDLHILFYLRALGTASRYKLRKVLKKQYKAQADFQNELLQTQENFDICAIGEGRKHKVQHARVKKE